MEIVKNGFVLKTNQSLLSCLVRLEIKFGIYKSAFSYVKRPISAMVCGIKTFSNKSTFTFMALTDEKQYQQEFYKIKISAKPYFLPKKKLKKALEGINHD